MTIKDINQTSDSGATRPKEGVAESQKPLSLQELFDRQQAATVHLQDTNSAFDRILEETITAVDESKAEWKQLSDEAKTQAQEQAAAVMAEAQAQAQSIMVEADQEGDNAAMTKVSNVILSAMSTAGRIANPDHDESPLFTDEIWSALEASIQPYLQTVLADLQSLEQETKASNDRKKAQASSKESGEGAEGSDSLTTETQPDETDENAEPQPKGKAMPMVPPTSFANRNSLRP